LFDQAASVSADAKRELLRTMLQQGMDAVRFIARLVPNSTSNALPDQAPIDQVRVSSFVIQSTSGRECPRCKCHGCHGASHLGPPIPHDSGADDGAGEPALRGDGTGQATARGHGALCRHAALGNCRPDLDRRRVRRGAPPISFPPHDFFYLSSPHL
jgi:hypothetical protein